MRGWAVSRPSDVSFVLREHERFSSTVMAGADRYLLGADPPAHSRVRAAVVRGMASVPVTKVAEAATRVAEEFREKLAARGEADVIEDLAVPLPIAVLGTLLGIAPEIHQKLREWSHAAVALSAIPPGAPVPTVLRSREGEFREFTRAHVEERLRAPRCDALSVMLRCPDGLSVVEAESVLHLLVIAGNETTTHLIGNASLALLRRYGRGRVHIHDLEVDDVIDETLRYDPPVQFIMRTMARNSTLAGGRLSRGDLVFALIGGCGRDLPARERPHQFQPDRPVKRHQAFGAGVHACPGAGLARLEARVALRAVMAELPRVRISS